MTSAGQLANGEPISPTVSGISHCARSIVAPRLLLKRESLTYHLLRPKDPGPADLALLGEAYQCWSDVWGQTFEELDNTKNLRSDDFTRQDEIAALFHEWECIGIASLRWVDVKNPIYKDDSYFAVWSNSTLDAAMAHGSRVCIVSSFVVAPPWRRARGGRVRDLLGALMVERFLKSEADTLVATVRNDHGMNALCYELGFVPLARDVTHHGVPVDLVAFHRKTCARRPLAGVMEQTVQSLVAPKETT